MSRDAGLVQRLISFLRKPNALDYEEREPVHNPYDDYEPKQTASTSSAAPSAAEYPDDSPYRPASEPPILSGHRQMPGHASRLDALVMRALQQFNAQVGFVVRYDADGRMRYLTGRDLQGRYVDHTDVNPDRRAVFLALDSGESQLFVHHEGTLPLAVLCGPLFVDNQVIGVLYLDNPARSRLHRGVFDLFCDQAARMLSEGVL